VYDLMFAFALAFLALEHKGLFLRKLGLGCYVISKCLGNICKLHKCQILSSSLNCITTKTIHLNDHNAFKKKIEFFVAIISSILGVAKASCTERYANMLLTERKRKICGMMPKRN
jgi:hypothetical protein